MAICRWCKNEMTDPETVTCVANDEVEYPDGTKLASSADHFDEPSGRCNDCGIRHGGKHHPGCDVERCPRCEGQLIGCGCLDDDDDDDDITPVKPAPDSREEWYLGWRALIGSTVWEEPFASRDEAMIAARIVKHFGAVGITVGRHGIPEPVEPPAGSREEM